MPIKIELRDITPSVVPQDGDTTLIVSGGNARLLPVSSIIGIQEVRVYDAYGNPYSLSVEFVGEQPMLSTPTPIT